MLGKSPDQQPTELFKNLLPYQLNPKHALYLLSHAIAWKKLAEEVLVPSVGRHGVQLDAASQGISRSFFAMLCWVIWGEISLTSYPTYKVMLTPTGVVKTRLIR